MGSPRAVTTRRIERGLMCAKCHANLHPLPAWTVGERVCERCEARPHRVLMNFQNRDGWLVQFNRDATTGLTGWFRVRDQNTIRDLAKRGHCTDLGDLERSMAAWGRGSVYLDLTEEQFRTLLKNSRRKPPQSAGR